MRGQVIRRQGGLNRQTFLPGKFSVAAGGFLAEHRHHGGHPFTDGGGRLLRGPQANWLMSDAPNSPVSPEGASAAPIPREPQGIFAHSLAWIVLFISLTATFGGWFIARRHEDFTARKQFDDAAYRIQMALTERMSIYQDVLHGGLGLFAASYSVERSEWKAYVDAVSVNRRFPGIDGLGFIADVPKAQLDDFLQTTRADKSPDFTVKNLGTNEDYLITKYIEPEATHLDLIGLDVGSDPERRAVAEKARDTGAAVISCSIKLHVAGPEAPSGLIMLMPVFRNGTPSATIEQRRANIEGWVYARFVTAQLMGGILKDTSALLRFEVLDRLDGSEQLIFDSDSQSQDLPAGYRPRFSAVSSLAAGQHLWLLRFSTRPAFDATFARGLEWLAAFGGGLISLLLFGIALSLSSTRARALRMAGEMTEAYRVANRQLQQEIKDREYTQHRTAIQYAVTRVLAEADTTADAAPKIIQAMGESLHWDFGALWQLEPAGKCLRCVEIWHRPGLDVDEFALATRQKNFALGEGLPGRIWATTQPAWIKDATADKNFPRAPFARKAGLRSAFGFPLLLGGEFLGVLEFFSHDIVEPDGEVLKLVSALGSQVAQFIEWERAQQELKHEQFLLRTLMDNLPDRIYFKDRQSRFLRNSRAHLRRFGTENPQDVIGKSDFDFFSEEHAQQAYEDEQRLIRQGRQITKEERETWPDGSVSWALSTKLPLRDETGQIVGTFGISHDITDRKRAEEAMRRAKEEAEEANRTKSQFLANMSHELRTPLNSVIGFAGILLKNKPGNLSQGDLNFLERIQANGKHLLVLINEILDLSKIEAGKIELQLGPVALGDLIRETVAQQEGLVRDRPVQLLADLPTQIASIQADGDKLRQVIINLIGNALKFTERGNVTVRVVTNSANYQPERIEVADTGIGIPQEKLGVIFQAFQQADASTARKYGGTGLGLTISQALCQLMGFRIEVTSEPGRGSTFSVVLGKAGALPAAPADAAGAKADRSSSAGAMPSVLGGKLVLVIDDESDSRVLLTNMLEEFGCQVIAANSGEQGLRMAREFRPQLITVDLLMPQMDGASVIRALKADPQLRAIPVVVVSIVAEERRGSILGAVDILEKPVAREALHDALRRSLLPDRAKILVVEDDADARQILLSHLAGERVEVRTAGNGREALATLETFPPDLILLDLMMPVMDGVAFLGALRTDPRFQTLRVVVVTCKELSPEDKETLRWQTLEVVKKTDLTEEKFKQLLQRVLKEAGDGHQPGTAA